MLRNFTAIVLSATGLGFAMGLNTASNTTSSTIFFLVTVAVWMYLAFTKLQSLKDFIKANDKK